MPSGGSRADELSAERHGHRRFQQFTYSGAGQLTGYTSSLDGARTFSYDGLGHLTSIRWLPMRQARTMMLPRIAPGILRRCLQRPTTAIISGCDVCQSSGAIAQQYL